MKNRLLGILLAVAGLIAAGGAVDYMRVFRFHEKPIAARPINLSDDGGSGLYQGIGYSIDIKGNFMPYDEYTGVIWARFYVLGNEVEVFERQ